MSALLAFPVLAAAVMIQTSILSRVPLLLGSADLVLLVIVSWVMQERAQRPWLWVVMAGLMVGWVSATPIWVPLAAYLAVTALARLLASRVWQIPVLALLATVFAGSLITHGLSYLTVTLSGIALNLADAFNLIILPSLFMNLLFALPVNGLVSELASWTRPAEIEA
jgi:hypothetical protein